MMLHSGQELSARFVLERPLGAGGSGAVWLAQDRERHRFVALKIFTDVLARDAAVVAALERECARASSLGHLNVLRPDGIHRSEQHVWIAMEYASGGDLTQLRGRTGAEVLRATIPIASALAQAHRAGIVHRDVKPANILLMSDGTPRLADFGVALAIDQAPQQSNHGSPYNMSPQQLDGAAASPADDIYGFGAMLYELLSGYPPFYPNPSAERVRDESPAALPAAVSREVAQVVEQCLAKSPAERPASMETVEQALQGALAKLPAPAITKMDVPANPVRVEPPGLRSPGAAGEALRGEWRRNATTGVDERALRRQGFRRGLMSAALVLGIVGVVVVLFVLPRWVQQSSTQTAPVAAAPAAKLELEDAKPQQKEIDFAALARAKQEAEEQRAKLDERMQKLRVRAVEQWGDQDYIKAVAEFAAGDKDFAAREYVTAAEHLRNIDPLLTSLEKRAPEILAAQLKLGAAALQEGRSQDAKAAFELAIKLDPDNQAGSRGLQRATTLDEVLSTVANAERMEKEGDLTGAATAFSKALALDSEAPRAATGLARIQARVAGDAFASAMAQGFSALAKADYASARSAFDAADKIRPNAPEVAQALRQVEQEQRTRVIAAKLETARGSESQERWLEALQEYQAVLQLDSTVAAAQEGTARVTPRSNLNQELEQYLTQPERLFSQPVRAAARETLQRAGAIQAPGPLLKRQIATLNDWLSRADAPVQIALQSDNVTSVTIYRIGELGTFAERSLQLAPGSYTVVGTRPGYRDVRRELIVRPGTALPPVVIRCEEKI
jgi:tetratricopeptide (TPR) repeat protein